MKTVYARAMTLILALGLVFHLGVMLHLTYYKLVKLEDSLKLHMENDIFWKCEEKNNEKETEPHF